LLNKNIFICAAKDSYRNPAAACTNTASKKRLTLSKESGFSGFESVHMMSLQLELLNALGKLTG
jgi:hypothetical protein